MELPANVERTAPIFLAAQTKSTGNTLFDWLVVNRLVWLVDEGRTKFSSTVGDARFLYVTRQRAKWRREVGPNHPAFTAPKTGDEKEAAYHRLARYVLLMQLDGSKATASGGSLAHAPPPPPYQAPGQASLRRKVR